MARSLRQKRASRKRSLRIKKKTKNKREFAESSHAKPSYNQLVHICGFGASTLVVYSLLAGLLKRPVENPISLGIVLVMGGLGMGALNEILEFVVSIFVPQSGVGGYINTSLDLCADLIGAILALLYIRLRYLKNNGIQPSSRKMDINL